MQTEKKVVELNLSDVLPNRFQPRIKFDENAINELAISIQKYGVIQPIVVRQIGNKYEIIAGERRYKASKIAGKQTIPAIISELNDKDSVEIALIENVQREDLTPIEKAISYKKILDMGYINQEELAQKVGKTQSTIANTLRLLNLTDDVQEALLENKISERHARSLLKLKDSKQQIEMLNKIIKERLTVRKTDEEIDKMLNEKMPEEVVSIPDTAIDDYVNPGFMNIESIENSAKDINVPQKEVANVDMLMKPSVEPTPVSNPEPTSKFFNFFSEDETSSNNEDDGSQFKLDNFFTNPSIQNNQVNLPQASSEISNMNSTYEVPSKPEVQQPVQMPAFEAPSMPEVQQPVQIPTFEAPSMPEVQQPVQIPTFEAPSMPEVQQPVQMPAYEVPSMPEVQQPVQMPTYEVPSMPEVQQPVQMPTFEAPSMPEVQQPVQMPTYEAPSMPEVQQPTDTPLYEVPIAPLSDDIPVVGSPIETSIKVDEPKLDNFNQLNITEKKQPSSINASFPNIKLALNTIRECESTLEKYGFTIDVEEIDFDDSYQVIFKIQK